MSTTTVRFVGPLNRSAREDAQADGQFIANRTGVSLSPLLMEPGRFWS
jgi:hypothetical protein